MQIVMPQPRLEVPPAPADAFAVAQVARLFAIPERRLRYWSQTGFIRPSLRRGSRTLYSFRDLITVKVAAALLERGVSLRRVRRSLAALRASLQDDESLARLRIRGEGDRIVVDEGDRRFDPATGQCVFDFEVAALQREAAQVVALPWVANETSRRTAYDWFLVACELEQQWGGAPADIEGFERARQAYESALELDGGLAAARTNLGSMLAEVGDLESARGHFAAALRDDPDQPEALCNLAELALREGDPESAIAGYRQVLSRDPQWAEAHYGLARALLEVGGKAQALAHLERFCAAQLGAEIENDPDAQYRRACAAEVAARIRLELAGQ